MTVDINKKLISFSSVIFCLLPLCLLTGPFLPDLIISIMGIIFLLQLIDKKNIVYINSFFFKFFFAFYIFLVISSLFSSEIFFSMRSSLSYIRFPVFVLAVWFLLDNNKYLLKYFTISLFIPILLSIIDGYYQYFVGENIFGFVADQKSRLTLLYDDKMILGSYIARLFPLLVGLIILKFYSLKSYIAILLLFIISDVLIYMSGERTALGLMTVTTILFIFISSKFSFLRILALLLSILIILFLSISNEEIRKRNIDYTITQLGLDVEDKKIVLFSPSHESMIYTSLNILKENILIGSGPNSYRKLCDTPGLSHNDLSCSTHPHNSYIQVAAETGIVGLGFIFFLFIFLVSKLINLFVVKLRNNTNPSHDYMLCIFISFTLTLWPLTPSLNFFNNWINIIYFLPVGFYLYQINKVNEN